MVRPKKGDTPDLGDSHELTAGLIERLACLADKQQAFIRDRDTKGLRVRVTAAGAKSYVFEKKLNRQTIRRTIGDVSNWSIEAARIEARRLAVMLDNGQDPRAIELQQQADNAIATAAAHAVTVGEAWSRYTAERRLFWGALTIREHKVLGQAGGIQRDRHPGVLTKAGPLAELMPLRLIDLTAPVIEAWAACEAKDRVSVLRCDY